MLAANEVIVKSPDVAFSNLGVLHELRRRLKAQGDNGEVLTSYADAIRLDDYVAPEGYAIEVVPQGRSQEIPLTIQERGGDSWVSVRVASGRYDGLVGKQRVFEPFFRGTRVSFEDGYFYVYGHQGTVRADATDEARFRIVESS